MMAIKNMDQFKLVFVTALDEPLIIVSDYFSMKYIEESCYVYDLRKRGAIVKVTQ